MLKSISMQLMNKNVFLQIFLVHESNHLKRIHITLWALEYSLITILLNIFIQTNSNEIMHFLKMGYGNQRVNQEIKLKGIMRTLSFRSSIKETNCQIETKVLGVVVKTDNPPPLDTWYTPTRMIRLLNWNFCGGFLCRLWRPFLIQTIFLEQWQRESSCIK